MAVRRICVNELTTLLREYEETITCTNPNYPPVGAGNQCRIVVYNLDLDLEASTPSLSFSFDVQWEYEFEHLGVVFLDFCSAPGNSGSLTLPEGLTICCGLEPDIEVEPLCDAGGITTTPTSVSGDIAIAFTINNLCFTTIICVDDVECP